MGNITPADRNRALEAIRGLEETFEQAARERPPLWHMLIEIEEGPGLNHLLTPSLPRDGASGPNPRKILQHLAVGGNPKEWSYFLCNQGDSRAMGLLGEFVDLGRQAMGCVAILRGETQDDAKHWLNEFRPAHIWAAELHRIAWDRNQHRGSALQAHRDPYLGQFTDGASERERELKALVMMPGREPPARRIAIRSVLPDNVFQCSRWALGLIRENAGRISPTKKPSPAENKTRGVKWDTQKKARAKYAYELLCDTNTKQETQLRKFNDRAKEQAWDPIDSVQGLRHVAIRYAAEFGKDPVPPRQNK